MQRKMEFCIHFCLPVCLCVCPGTDAAFSHWPLVCTIAALTITEFSRNLTSAIFEDLLYYYGTKPSRLCNLLLFFCLFQRNPIVSVPFIITLARREGIAFGSVCLLVMKSNIPKCCISVGLVCDSVSVCVCMSIAYRSQFQTNLHETSPHGTVCDKEKAYCFWGQKVNIGQWSTT